jgi:hypothetical protein
MSRTLTIGFLLFFASISASFGYTSTPSNTKWFIALCYPDDQKAITLSRDQMFYTNMFMLNGFGSARDYWRSQSYGGVSFDGSVMSNWTDTGSTLAQHQSNDRGQNISVCVNAALAASKQSGNAFYNYIAVYNGQLDEGEVSVSIQGQTVNGVIIDAYSPITGIMHEMGHGFGLGHSYNDLNVQYGDPYDVMSALDVFSFQGVFCVPPGGWYACDMGPGLNAWTRWQLGWLSASQREMWWPASSGSPLMNENVTLAGRNEQAGALPQILYIPATSAYMYTAEWIVSDNYDLDNLSQGSSPSPRQAANTLTIHKMSYGNQTTYLVTEPGGVQTDSTTPFFDSASGFHIQLTSTQGTPSTATVNVTIDPTNQIWTNIAASGAPPVDPTPIKWVGVDAAVGDKAPSNAVWGGFESDTGDLYPCRAWYFGVQLGKLVSGASCHFAWGGSEHSETALFQVLTSVSASSIAWAPASGGTIPANAIAAGFDGANTLYVCRALPNSTDWTPGKFIFGTCHVPYGGAELSLSSYQILTAN